jgi:hypothetical protein
MILRNQLNPTIPMCIGMTSLVLAVLWPRLVHLTAVFGQDFMDGIQGFCLGISIPMNLLAIVIFCKRRRGKAR